MNTETLQINIESPIATVTLNRPNVLNAFNEQLVLDLQQAFKSLTEDESVRVIILTGSGKGFSAGADLTEKEASWDPDCPSKDALLRGYMPIFNDIVEMPKIVIAAINGPAAGIGAALAMACDLRVMTKSSYILSVFSNIALVPDGGLNWLLTRFLGYAKALEFAIEAKKIDSQMCLDFGIANKVVEDNILIRLRNKKLENYNDGIKDKISSLYKDFIIPYTKSVQIIHCIQDNNIYEEGTSSK